MQAFAGNRANDFTAHVLCTAEKPAMATFLDFIDAGDALEISIEAVGVTAHFEQKIPMAAF